MRGAIPPLHYLSLRAQERFHCHLTYEAHVCFESILFAGLVSDYLPCQNVTQWLFILCLNEFSSVLSLSEMFREVLNLTKQTFPAFYRTICRWERIPEKWCGLKCSLPLRHLYSAFNTGTSFCMNTSVLQIRNTIFYYFSFRTRCCCYWRKICTQADPVWYSSTLYSFMSLLLSHSTPESSIWEARGTWRLQLLVTSHLL